MNLKIQAAKNVGASWFGLVVNLLAGLLLSPFILHRLGDEAFGLWILALSLTGYYGVFDFGIRSSIVRYVSKFVAVRDNERLARLVNTCLFTYSCVALGVLLLTVLGARHIDSLFHVSPAFLGTARLLFLMVGSALALGFPLGMFAGVLQGLQKFYWLNLTQVVNTLLRTLLIVVALNHGGGLLTVAFVTVAFPLLGYVVHIVIVQRTLHLPIGMKFVDRATFRETVSYGAVTFVAIFARKLRFQSDPLLIGMFLSASAITYFSIGSKLVDYSTNVVEGVAQIFTPMSSQFEATGDLVRLRKVFVLGNRACALVMFPIAAVLIILGKSIIEVWVGLKYASSYYILLILLIPTILAYAQASSSKILLGVGRHRVLAAVNIVEGVVNVVLSIILIQYWGIVGDAFGTAIPYLCTTLFFLPRYLCRLLHVPLGAFVKQAYLLPTALCAPLIIVLLALRYQFQAHTFLQLLAQVLAGGFVYSIGLLWLFFTREPMGVRLRARFAEFVEQAVGR